MTRKPAQNKKTAVSFKSKPSNSKPKAAAKAKAKPVSPKAVASKAKKAVAKKSPAANAAKKPAAKPAAKKAVPTKKAALKKNAPQKAAAKKAPPAKKAANKNNLKKAMPAENSKKSAKPAPQKNVKKTTNISKPAKKAAPKAAAKKTAPKAKPAKAVEKKKPAAKPAAQKAPAKAPQQKKAPQSAKPAPVQPAAKPEKAEKFAPVHVPEKRSGKRARHAKASDSVYFSLEDLDAFFQAKEKAAEPAESKASSAVKGRAAAVKKEVKAAVPQKPAKAQSVGVASIFDILGFDPVVAPTREKLEEKDVPRKWKKFYTLLVDLRKRYSQGIEEHSEEVLKRSAKEDSGDLSSYGQHLADAGSESFDRDMSYNIISGEKETLAEIDAAIGRIKNGTYGICEYTGNQIPEARLLAVPYTRYTKEGQEQKEQEATRLKQSQRSMFEIPAEGTAAGGEEESE